MFTGAAACAAIAVPAAQATPIAPGATAPVIPNIAEQPCVPNVPTDSLMLHYTGAHSPACFKSFGTVGVGGNPAFNSYCAGKYSGFLWIGGTEHAFTAGIHPLHQHVSKVTITRDNNSPIRCNP